MSEQCDFADPRIPDRATCVLRYLVDRWADERSEQIFVHFENGAEWNYAELKQRVVAKAAGLRANGVNQGDHVALWLPNGADALIAFFAINYLGAVFVPFNTAYRGTLLAHVVANSDAKVIIVHPDLVARLVEIDCAALELAILTTTKEAPDLAGMRALRFDELGGVGDDPLPLDRPIEPWDSQSIIYTSGTTGPSKGVLSSYLHMFSNAGPESWPMVDGSDRFLVAAPIFHIGGMGLPFVMLARGGSIALMENFTTRDFWPFVRSSGSTAAFLLGVMATFLIKEPPSGADGDHQLRLVFMVPFTADAPAFAERFAADIFTIFNMTEISSPLVSVANPPKAGTCGRVRDGVDVRLVDGHDCEVPVGTVGEMIVRTDRPWAMNSGYYKNPEATAEAWRNGWFHTGDAFRCDSDGDYFYVDRVKDSIRRRGENISSYEVEIEACAHPAVREAAAIGVPSEVGEDDVMLIIAATPGMDIDPVELSEFLVERLPYFMVPRYLRILPDLPKTPSNKVIKTVLRKEGITTDSWDREAAGLRQRRILLSP